MSQLFNIQEEEHTMHTMPKSTIIAYLNILQKSINNLYTYIQSPGPWALGPGMGFILKDASRTRVSKVINYNTRVLEDNPIKKLTANFCKRPEFLESPFLSWLPKYWAEEMDLALANFLCAS